MRTANDVLYSVCHKMHHLGHFLFLSPDGSLHWDLVEGNLRHNNWSYVSYGRRFVCIERFQHLEIWLCTCALQISSL